jgi:anthranilate synthase component 1
VKTDRPNEEIRKILQACRSPKIDTLPTFTGGLVGYFSYEYYKYSEKISLPAGEDGDCRLFLFDKVIAYDNVKHKIVLMVNVSLHGDVAENYRKGTDELARLKKIILEGDRRRTGNLKITKPFAMAFSEEQYKQKVERARAYTREGDIFQCVPSNLWTAEIDGDLLNAYRVLRTTNPSPYMIYLDMGETEIAGASPETLVKVTGGKVSTFPIAGTRPRGKTREEDMALEESLLADEKEIAEHNMLVDLGRNDLGKVCKFGSIRVYDYKKIYRFSHVMHITSSVSGELCKDKDGLDALSATLPAGTLSGAPKKRAAEIIHELEEDIPRGIYGGAVGYLDFMGNCDFCIAIRTAVRRGKKVCVRAGGGIVEGSVPQNEFWETCNKSAAVREAIAQSEEVDE